MAIESPGDGLLRVTDLGPSAWFIRNGRLGLDLLASFLFAPIGLSALFLAMFAVVFAAILTLESLLRLVGWGVGASSLHEISQIVPLAGMVAFICGLVLAVAAVAAVVAAARAPRAWGIFATMLFAVAIAFFANTGNHQAKIITWTQTALIALLTYGVGATALTTTALLFAGIATRRRTAIGRIVQKWPRFSIPIFVARYGLGLSTFWRHLLRIASRLALITAALAVAFVSSILVLGSIAIKSLPLLGLRPNDWHPIFFISDILLWSGVVVLSLVSAIRSPTTRIADILVGVFAALAAAEIAESFYVSASVTRAGPLNQSGIFISTVSEAELEFLNLVPLVWLFRGLMSRALLRAYGDLKRNSARTASELAKKRPERPILFLRSFMDDEQLVPSSDALLAYAFGATHAKVRLEQIVAEIMFARGPLVALANPSVRGAPLGAARDVTADADWQDKVMSFLEASQIVVCFLGKTKSFSWEIDRIIAHGKLEATLIVLPPTYPQDRQLVHDAPKLAGLIGLRDEADERARLKDARVLMQDAATGAFSAVRSPRANSFFYREAILIGAATILRNAERRV